MTTAVSVFYSGGYPDHCHHGHQWGPGKVIVGYQPCDCNGARSVGRLGHHWVRCQEPGCTSIWYDPPHTAKDGAPAQLPRGGTPSSSS